MPRLIAPEAALYLVVQFVRVVGETEQRGFRNRSVPGKDSGLPGGLRSME